MAIASTTIERRGKELDVNGVQVLAAEPLNLRNRGDQRRLTSSLLRARLQGMGGWQWFDKIGEIHFALNRAARIAGYARLKAVRYAPDGVTIEKVLDTGREADIVAGIYSRVGGTRGLIERYFLQQKIAAESHLIRWSEKKSTDGYLFASSKELDDGKGTLGIEIAGQAKGGMELKLRTMPAMGNTMAAFERPIAQKDYLGRVWTPSPEWLDVPDSPLEALDLQCDMLHSMTLTMNANIRSRWAMAGILYFSDKVREALGNKQTTKTGKSVLQVLYDVMKENMTTTENTDDVMAALPIMMMGSATVGEVAEHITIDRAIFETDLKLRGELIDRILFGLDINAPSTKGNEETSHWGSWANSADELRLAVIPDLEAFCWTGNRLIMRPQLIDDGEQNPQRYGVWYELDEASVRANKAEDARQMRDKGLLKGLTALKASGFSDADLLDGAEYIRWLGFTLRIPKLATYGTPEYTSIDWTDPALAPTKTGKIGAPGDEPKVGPGVGDPGSPDDSDDDTPKGDKPI